MNKCTYCDCVQLLVSELSTLVCTSCGRESVVLGITPEFTSYSQSHCIYPNQMYDRARRFGNMLDQVILGLRAKSDDKMIEHLHKDAPYKSIGQMLTNMKRSNLRDKRYNSVHLFASLFYESFTSLGIPKEWFQIRKSIINVFKDIEIIHRRLYLNTAFFNYLWLLRELLIIFNLEFYIVYLKKLKCSKRNQSYRDMFDTILQIINAEDRYATIEVCASKNHRLGVECEACP